MNLSLRILLTVFVTCVAVVGQTSQINGVIRDSSGSVVPGAAVKATQTATGVVRTANSVPFTSGASYFLASCRIVSRSCDNPAGTSAAPTKPGSRTEWPSANRRPNATPGGAAGHRATNPDGPGATIWVGSRAVSWSWVCGSG